MVEIKNIQSAQNAAQFNKGASFESFVNYAKSNSGSSLSEFLKTNEGALNHSYEKIVTDGKKRLGQKAIKALKQDPLYKDTAKIFEDKIKITEKLSEYSVQEANLNIISKVFSGLATSVKSLLQLQ